MTVVYIIIAIVMLGVLIFLHELGHYLVGRRMNIGIEEFAIGMGPKLFSRKGTHKLKVNGEYVEETTTYSLRLLPLGGFCAFVGEDEDNSDPRAMNNAPAWKRFLTVAAGPVMNLLVAFLIGVVLIGFGLIPNLYKTEQAGVVIVDTIEGMPAADSAIKPDDIVVSVDGISMEGKSVADFKQHMAEVSLGDSVEIWVKRGNISLPVTITPVANDEGALMLGVSISDLISYSEYDCNIFEAMGESVVLMKNIAVETYKALIDLLRQLFTGQKIPEGTISGVVGIVSNVSDTLSVSFQAKFSSGILTIFLYLQLLSLSLGIMNLLPLPALDGGRLMLLLIEMLTGKHLNRKVESYINVAGLVLLLVLMAVVTFSDVKSLIK